MKPQGSSGPRPLRATWAALGMVACSVAVLTMYGPWQQGAMAWRGTVPTPAALPQQPCAANPAAAAAPGEVCELEGTQYACGTTAFDWKFYTEHYADLANLGATQVGGRGCREGAFLVPPLPQRRWRDTWTGSCGVAGFVDKPLPLSTVQYSTGKPSGSVSGRTYQRMPT